MKNDDVSARQPPKCDLLYKLASQHPGMDLRMTELMAYIQDVAKLASLCISQELAEQDISEGRMFVLAHLYAEACSGGGDSSPSAIADRLGVTRATVTGLLDGLETAGFLVRRHDAIDRREVSIQLTEKGRSFMSDLIESGALQFRDVAASMSDAERTTIIGWLGKMRAELSQKLR